MEPAFVNQDGGSGSVGSSVGIVVGDAVGVLVGRKLGRLVRVGDGATVIGRKLGRLVGTEEGVPVLGRSDGQPVGKRVGVGVSAHAHVGRTWTVCPFGSWIEASAIHTFSSRFEMDLSVAGIPTTSCVNSCRRAGVRTMLCAQGENPSSLVHRLLAAA